MRWRVVVVDDDAAFRSLTAALLDGDGRFQVSAMASDGLQASRAVAIYQPDVVLLDLDMPVAGGLEALPGIRRACPGAAVVVVSGTLNGADLEAARSAGASTLSKDVDYPDRLIPYLASVLAA